MSWSDFAYKTEFHQLLVCVVNVFMIFVAVVLKRRVFMVLGIFGVFMYVVHLNDLFGDYVIFPFIVTLLGGAVVGWGLFRNRLANDESMTQLLLDSENQENQQGALPLDNLVRDTDNDEEVAQQEIVTSEE